MKRLIPHFVHEQYRAGRMRGSFRAYTMFIDLSGFTPLTEVLMQKGHDGAEQLSRILNEIFSPLVRLVYNRGGFIPYFAGDAFTAIFPEEARGGMSAERLLDTACFVRELFRQREYQFGDFTIGLKIGLSYGLVEWGIVGRTRRSYYFRGAPIDGCADSQARARNQEIILDEALREKLTDHAQHLQPLSGAHYRLLGQMPESITLPAEPVAIPPVIAELVRQFLPESIITLNQEGEFRTVIAVFISFEGVDTHEGLDAFTSLVIDQIDNFSGYFKEIDFGDKGGVLVCFFGAPVSFENNIERALEFIHTLDTDLKNHPEELSLRFRAGLTIGTAYTGNVGGHERCQYAVVGNRVNLAARLMTYADWGEVLVDTEIQKHRQFSFQHKGDIEYKGIKGPVPTFKLVGRNLSYQSPHIGRMVGRDAELKALARFAAPLLENRSAGITFIYGEAGIGKSRLTYELRRQLQEKGQVAWHICQSDQILRKPFNPIVYFLKNFFQQTPEGHSAANLNRFETRYQELADAIHQLQTHEAEEAARELIRTKSVLAALIGMETPGSLWDQLDAKGRYQNTLQAVINLIHAGSLLQPLVIELEDAHWMDENTEELLLELVRHLNRYRVLLIMTSRYRDDGSKPPILERSMLDSLGIPWLEINLNILQPEAVRALAETTLNGPITDNFYDILVRSTNSNPFYLEQLMEYFSERDLLVFQEGGWNLKNNKDFSLSSSITAVLTARIDRLSALVRETVKAAAVIGREFEVPILTEVMKRHEEFSRRNGNAASLLEEQIHLAERGQIWLAMNELRYIFRHSLLREAAYSMQLRTRLQQLHLAIAEAIEHLYADKIEERYVDLAFHYEEAGIFDKTCEYLRKAADHARRNYQNHQALDFYERLLLKLNQEKDVAKQIQTHLKRGKILELIGQWDDCEEAYQHALHLAKRSRDVLHLGQANNSLGRLMLLKGDYTEARNYLQTAAQLFESIEDVAGIAKVYGNLGNLYFRQGNYEEAKAYFKESIAMGQSGSDSTVNAQIVANLGLTYMNQGDFDEGIRCQQEQLALCEQRNDKQGMATIYTYMGIIYLEKGDYRAALASFRKGLEYSEELGNKMLTAIALGSIGQVFERQGDYQRAMEHYERDLEICEELGDKQGTAIALGLIGQLLNVQGEFHRAIEYLQKDLMLCEELGYQKGIAKAVNTLGDIFFYLRQFDRSLHFYNRAIGVTRNIGNKLVLGLSLVEKGGVLMEMGRQDELQLVCREALDLARELGNPDLLFEAELLVIKVGVLEGDTDTSTAKLLALLERPLGQDQRAATYFELFRVHPDQPTYRDQALALYRELYRATPRYVYDLRIRILEDE